MSFLEIFERKYHKQMMRANVYLSQTICDLNISMQLEKKSKEGNEKEKILIKPNRRNRKI